MASEAKRRNRWKSSFDSLVVQFVLRTTASIASSFADTSRPCHGHHVLRAYSKNAFVKQYEKDNTFLRIETCSNNLKDFRQKKSLELLPEVAEKLQAVNDRFADAQAENLNVEIDYPLLEELAQPCRLKSQRMAGIRLENDRIVRLLEVLMHSSSHIGGQSAADLHQTVLDAHHLTASQYTRNQLAYDPIALLKAA